MSESLDQHACLARRALEIVGAPGSDVGLLARGMTSTAWYASSDDGGWVARVPVPGSGRRLTYRAEEYIGAAMTAAGHPVVRWRTVELDGGTLVSVGPRMSGVPVDPTQAWSERFTVAVAETLASLHGLECSGWGPVRDTNERLIGISHDGTAAVVDRWCHAPMWPFDGSDLRAHPLARYAADLVGDVSDMSGAITVAAHGRRGLVHSDLHAQHLLVGADGGLGALLDFGDAFIGSRAWDFALLIHYYGLTAAADVARHYGADQSLLVDAQQLAVAVAVYKIVKTDGRRMDVERLCERLRELASTPTRHD